MTIIDCPMCPWKAGVISRNPEATHFIRDMHFDLHCREFEQELNAFPL